LILVIAFWRPQVTRVLGVLIFAAAAIVNARLAMFNPTEYVQYSALTLSTVYRDFIYGWFSGHVQLLVLPVAAGQLVMAVLLTRPKPWRRLEVTGAIIFLLAIAPLGVGAAFPFSLSLIAALLVMERSFSKTVTLGRREAEGRVRAPSTARVP